MMQDQPLKIILEGALLAANRPLTLDDLLGLFEEEERPERDAVRAALDALQNEYADRSFALKEVASGFRIQVKRELSPWVSRLWMERPSRYSRALLETLALVAYRQPITRGEIEDIRGVSVSSSIMKTLQEREWIRVVGHRDVPGKPAMYGTSRQFLDYFDLKSLDELPTLAELRDIDSINAELDLREPGEGGAAAAEAHADLEEEQDESPVNETGESMLAGSHDQDEAPEADASEQPSPHGDADHPDQSDAADSGSDQMPGSSEQTGADAELRDNAGREASQDLDDQVSQLDYADEQGPRPIPGGDAAPPTSDGEAAHAGSGDDAEPEANPDDEDEDEPADSRSAPHWRENG